MCGEKIYSIYSEIADHLICNGYSIESFDSRFEIKLFKPVPGPMDPYGEIYTFSVFNNDDNFSFIVEYSSCQFNESEKNILDYEGYDSNDLIQRVFESGIRKKLDEKEKKMRNDMKREDYIGVAIGYIECGEDTYKTSIPRIEDGDSVYVDGSLRIVNKAHYDDNSIDYLKAEVVAKRWIVDVIDFSDQNKRKHNTELKEIYMMKLNKIKEEQSACAFENLGSEADELIAKMNDIK